MSKHNVVVIGNGMVGHRFIEELLEKAEPDQFSLTVFCEEPCVAYDRVHLSAYFSHHTAEELSLVREAITTNIRSICCWASAPSPLTVMRSSSTPAPGEPFTTTR